MLQSFLIKSMLKKHLNGVPQEQQDKLFAFIENYPNFFMKIATEVQEKVKSGQSQQDAMMAVVESHKEELGKLMV